MRRKDFEHIIRAAVELVNDELIVVGSQAILGSVEAPPSELVRSLEVDLFPKSDPSRAIEIDGTLGDGSQFQATYGVYAQGVGPETINAPAGWEGRLVKFSIPRFRRKDGTAVAWCLSVDDLLLAKLAAGRPHDMTFVEAALRAELSDAATLQLGLDLMTRDQDLVEERLDGVLAKISRTG